MQVYYIPRPGENLTTATVIEHGSQNNIVAGNVFTDISGSGVQIGDLDDPASAPVLAPWAIRSSAITFTICLSSITAGSGIFQNGNLSPNFIDDIESTRGICEPRCCSHDTSFRSSDCRSFSDVTVARSSPPVFGMTLRSRFPSEHCTAHPLRHFSCLPDARSGDGSDRCKGLASTVSQLSTAANNAAFNGIDT
jgi:hypothetical protein